MSIITVLLFIAYTWGTGYSLLQLLKVKEAENPYEKNIMRIGIGLGAMPLLVALFALFHIPLHWWLFLLVSMALPLLKLRKAAFNAKNLIPPTFTALVLLLFLFSLFMYTKGAFAYPWLEDDDPWSHALGVSYIAQEKSIRQPEGGQYFQYFDPYPPGYDGLMGILQQTSHDMMFTLKFFNALIISLGTLFFFYFAKAFTKSTKKALFAAFCLAMVPAFLSHFIWAISMAVVLYFTAFYAAEKIEDDKRWWLVTAAMAGSALLMTPTHSAYFGIFFLAYVITKCALHKKLLFPDILAGAVGIMLSLIWWLPTLLKWGVQGTLNNVGLGGQDVFSVRGTGDKVYALSDFLFARSQNMINSPAGIGIMISVLVALFFLSLFFTYKQLKEKDNHWMVISVVWLVLMLYAVNAASMPIKLSPFRTWMLLAIPVSLLAAQGYFFLQAGLAKLKIPAIAVLVVVLIAIFFTSGVQKYTLNTAQWPPGAFWGSMEELQAYLWLKETDKKAFTFFADGALAGIDKALCIYCEDIISFRQKGLNQTPSAFHDFFRRNQLDAFIIGSLDAREFGREAAQQKMQELASSPGFRIAYQNQGAVVFDVV